MVRSRSSLSRMYGMPRMYGWSLALLELALLLAASTAWAGGMFIPARGARPMGRAGSYVAGADDLEAVYYNPAGLAGTGHGSFLLDVGLVFQRVAYTHVDAAGNTQPTAHDSNGILPIPFLGVSWRPEALDRRLTVAFAAFVPYSGIPNYAADGPQRFSLVSLDGTALAVLELAAAVKITPELYFGAGFQSMFASVTNLTVLAGCTELNCAPEDPRFDALTQTRTTAPFVPSANAGFLYVSRYVRVGASVQLPYWIKSSGKVKTRLPSDPQFDGAVVVGDQIDVNLTLPMVIRAGVEARPTRQLRIELGADFEMWSMQDKLEFVPRGVYIDHIAGVGRYDLRPMALDRGMQDCFSVHLGGEYDVLPRRLTLRAGYLFESSAVPDETLSVLTPDGDKHLVTLGLAVRLGKVRLDVGYAHLFQGDRVITNSRSLQLNPIQPSLAVPVGNGTYVVAADLLSLGLEARF